ncbi:hypothetical protein B5G12_01865 [Faecalibacterium sp. An58]|uniref:hypothetical protein n=1 Tax=Faecalibacterium sp. An58 TaxID=1965648 RepID=UPI000B371A26|nr:hypothetical protein [Faecalibacterium sp. An58]OUN75836.1 hypothetical protein B5G12_01865 [Faecalibacterium sp. An58]
MQKRGLIMVACVVLLAAIVYIGMHFFPSSPEGYIDIVEVGEIEKYTEKELQDKMLASTVLILTRNGANQIRLKVTQTRMSMNSMIFRTRSF